MTNPMMRERVTIRFRGRLLESFLDRALASGVVFRAVRRVDAQEARLETDECGARTILEIARSYRLDAQIVRRSGPGVWWAMCRARGTYIASYLLACVVVLTLVSRIWVIDVRLLDDGMRSDVLRALIARAGVVVGMPVRALDEGALRQALMSSDVPYTFIGVRRQGTRLLIEAAAADPAPSVYDPAQARDIVAARDGIVEMINVHAGQARVKPGDVVWRGQVLIEGVQRSGRETVCGVAALGVVTARFWTSATRESPVVRTETVRTGKSRVCERIGLLHWSFARASGPAFARESVETCVLPIGGVFLPLYVERATYWEEEERLLAVDEAALRAQLTAEAFEQARKLAPDNVSVVDKWADYSMIEGKRLRVRAVYEYRADIATPGATKLDETDAGGN